MRWRLRMQIGPWVSRIGWRWRIAYLLNRSSKYCWCDLVDWVLQVEKMRDYRGKVTGLRHDPGERQYLLWPTRNFHPLILRLFHRGRDQRCALSAAKQGGCYCLKFHTPAAILAHPHLRGKGILVKEAS